MSTYYQALVNAVRITIDPLVRGLAPILLGPCPSCSQKWGPSWPKSLRTSTATCSPCDRVQFLVDLDLQRD